jgi:hypothetical protein
MVLFPEIHRRFQKADAILFLSWYQEEIRLPNQVSGKLHPFETNQLEIIPTGYI